MYKMCHEPTNISMLESEVTSPELEHLPLTTRRSLLQTNERVTQRIVASVSPSNVVDSIVKREDGDCFSEVGVVSNCGATESVDIEVSVSTSIGCSEGLNENDNRVCCSNAEENVERVRQIEETDGVDALEHLTMKERRKILLERRALRLPESNIEVQDNAKGCDDSDLYKMKAEILCENEIASTSEVCFSGFLEKIDSFLYKKVSIGVESGSSVSGIQKRDTLVAHERPLSLSSEASRLPELSSKDYEHCPLASKGYDSVAKQPRKRIRKNSLPLNVSEMQSNHESLSDCVMEDNVERNPVTLEQIELMLKREVETNDEAHVENELHCTKPAPDLSTFVKSEAATACALDEDEIDHMKLIDRLKVRSFHGSGHHHHEDLKSPSSGFSFCPSDEYVKPLKVSRSWKRKKTATDSIETALEEDAPGLLQVLIQQGVTVDELRLYGENESGGDSLLEETFSDLENVISQLYFKRETGTKLLSLKFSKGARTSSYCLTCLFSLIEQARYLRFRKWPVEWGWCRDLQSFIFVFERHNRIVMERPEYGYATYFFELSNAESIGWQIKRLVLAMKLASCGRYQLIENKPLLVGEDMTEGEAKVLMKYGWVANTGLGTMLNYYDRVYHDRKSRKETSEWRSKISKLLIDGYNGGTIVSSFTTPHDDDDDGLDNIGDVKLEPY